MILTLMSYRKSVLFLLAVFFACSSSKDTPSDGQEDVLTYGFPEPKLAPDHAYDALPAANIPPSKYRLLPSIDTVKMDHVFDSVAGRAYIFMPDKNDFPQTVAVKRSNDWLLLDWSLFTLAAPAAFKMSFIDVNGRGLPELLLSYEQVEDREQKQSINGMQTDAKGNRFFTSEVWAKARGFCLIDLDSISFIADNVFTGYEYYYETALTFEEGGIEGTTNLYRTTFSVWYHFEIIPGQNIIMVTQEKCEMEKTLDKGKRYFRNSGEDDQPNREREDYSHNCRPIWVPGLYEFKNGRFGVKM